MFKAPFRVLSQSCMAEWSDLIKVQGGRPAISFITAQVFNIIWTLLIAYALFGGRFFPVPDIK